MAAAGLPQPQPCCGGKGPRQDLMVIRPNRESARGWTRGPKAVRATSHPLLNEPGLALNVFWLPAVREEGVRRGADESQPPAVQSVTRAGRDTLDPDG